MSSGVLLAVGALLASISFGIQGYRALTNEVLAARIELHPRGQQRFEAIFHFPDGSRQNFLLAGDELYVDARILKWKPVANMIGLHTLYELDRVAGRYQDIEQERTAARTLFTLRSERAIDLFVLRQRFAHLSALFDTAYGSGVFVPIDLSPEIELRVSTTGLLIRASKIKGIGSRSL